MRPNRRVNFVNQVLKKRDKFGNPRWSPNGHKQGYNRKYRYSKIKGSRGPRYYLESRKANLHFLQWYEGFLTLDSLLHFAGQESASSARKMSMSPKSTLYSSSRTRTSAGWGDRLLLPLRKVSTLKTRLRSIPAEYLITQIRRQPLFTEHAHTNTPTPIVNIHQLRPRLIPRFHVDTIRPIGTNKECNVKPYLSQRHRLAT